MRVRKRILFAGVLVIAVLFAIHTWLAQSAKGRIYDDIATIPKNKTGLLLGTSKYDQSGSGQVLMHYRYRIDAAVALYRAGKIEYILVSSDNKKDKNAETICADLIARGIPADRIFIDRFGLRTLDSIIRCKELYDDDSITIISQRSHDLRALFIAKEKGLDAIAFEAPVKGFHFGAILHEQGARILMFFDLLTNRQPKAGLQQAIN